MRDGQHFRLTQETLAQVADGLGHGGGKEHLLTVFGALREDELNVFAEAHIEHFVRFVEHDHPRAVQTQGAALQVIDNPARRAHDHLRALGQRPYLPFDGLAPVNGENENGTPIGGQLAQLLGHLNGEFARGAQHQRLHALAFRGPFQKGQPEGGGLAGPGLRLSDGVASGQKGRDRQNLNGRGFLKTQIGNGFQKFSG